LTEVTVLAFFFNYSNEKLVHDSLSNLKNAK
jgi:hypothetical protein